MYDVRRQTINIKVCYNSYVQAAWCMVTPAGHFAALHTAVCSL